MRQNRAGYFREYGQKCSSAVSIACLRGSRGAQDMLSPARARRQCLQHAARAVFLHHDERYGQQVDYISCIGLHTAVYEDMCLTAHRWRWVNQGQT